MAQFASFVDPFIILMAIPPGLSGVLFILLLTGSTLNVMSLMGVIMMTGIVVSNSILIVEFAGHLHQEGLAICGSRRAVLQDPPASDSDDLAGHAAGHDSDGAGPRGRQRAIRAAGSRHHRRPRRFGRCHRLPGARGLPDHPQKVQANSGRAGGRDPCLSSLSDIPYFIIMVCMVIMVVGITTIAGMPVDLFPKIDIPVVVVATFYSGMPPQQIEADITDTFERFFTLGSNIDHIESRSLTGVSLIKIYFKPGTDANAALSNISNLAMADLRRLPPGTLPPVVLGMDASSQPVCLVTLKGQGAERDRSERSGTVSGPQPDCQCPGRVGAPAVWRTLPPDHGLCRSVEAGGPQPEPDGRGPRRRTTPT